MKSEIKNWWMLLFPNSLRKPEPRILGLSPKYYRFYLTLPLSSNVSRKGG